MAPTTAQVGDTVTYALEVTHSGGVDGSGAVVRDPVVAGLDCSAATPVCSATGDAECPASATIAELQGPGLVIPLLQAGGGVRIELACIVSGSDSARGKYAWRTREPVVPERDAFLAIPLSAEQSG